MTDLKFEELMRSLFDAKITKVYSSNYSMQQFNITELIQQINPAIATEVQYYYRRGTVFYFRSTTSQAKFRIIVAPKLLQQAKAQLTRGNVYPCTR